MRDYKDHNVSLEIATEIFSSRIGRKMGFPLLEVKPLTLNDKYGIVMDYLTETGHPNLQNIDKLRLAIAFEEWILNVDMKESHVMAKDGKGYIIDHGHALSTWKPTYMIQKIIHEKVTKFNIWSKDEDFLSGIEIIDSFKESEIRDEMEGAFDEVFRDGRCKLFTEAQKNESIEINMEILNVRKEFLKRSIRVMRQVN